MHDMHALERGNKVLDLGVWFDEKLSFSEHIQTKINKANMMLGIIKRNFKHLTVPTFVLLYSNIIKTKIGFSFFSLKSRRRL